MSMVRIARKAALTLVSALLITALATGQEVTPATERESMGIELEEVWVHGKRLADRIEEAEDAFFGHYNALNEDDRFDVVCGLMALHSGSMIMQRTCVPGFLSASVSPRMHHTVFYRPPVASAPTCYGPPTVTDGAVHFEGGCYGTAWDTAGFLSSSYGIQPERPYVPEVLMSLQAIHYRDQYADSVRTTIAGNAELSRKAVRLAALYEELESTQRQYRELKAAIPLKWSFRRTGGGPGPR